MSGPSTDQIRDLLAGEMSAAPEPHPWAEVERRARVQDNVAPPAGPRTGIWLAVAACVIALVGGLVLVVGSDDEPTMPADDPIDTAATTTPSTSAPAPTTTDAEVGGWTGGLLDDLDVESLRPLDSFTDGDVVIPTAPSGWRVSDSSWTGGDESPTPNPFDWTVEVWEAPPDNAFGQVLYVTQSREPICRNTLGCKPSDRSVTIDGVVWTEIVVERIPEDDPQFFDMTTLRAQVGDRWVELAAEAPQLLTGPLLDNPPIIEFLDGLRVGSPGDLAAIGEACWQCDIAGAEGDPFAAGTSTATSRNDTTTTASAQRAEGPSGAGPETGHPLTELTTGDVLIPTYIPPGHTFPSRAKIYEYPGGVTEFSFYMDGPDEGHAPAVFLTEGPGNEGSLTSSQLDEPNHPPVEIAGLTWGWNDFDYMRTAYVGSFSVGVGLHGLDRSEAERFIEGLRAVSIEEFPSPIASDGADGLSVIDPDDPGVTEIVASDDRFELTAVQVGDQVCTKLEETIVPVTMTFAANCMEPAWFAESGIVDLYQLDATDTNHLIIGVVGSPSTTAVQITSPDGESVVVPAGPVNQAIDGRFFLARLDLNVSNGIRTDRFTIEDASP